MFETKAKHSEPETNHFRVKISHFEVKIDFLKSTKNAKTSSQPKGGRTAKQAAGHRGYLSRLAPTV